MTRAANLTCDELLTQLSSYLDGELGAATCESIQRHAESCDRCGRVIREFRRATGLCRTAARRPLPEDVRKRARDRVRALMLRTSATRKKRVSRT